MPNDIIGQVLHTSRKAELNIFDKKNPEKFSKPYLTRLNNNVRVFLNKEKMPMQIEMMSQGICKKKHLSMEC